MKQKIINLQDRRIEQSLSQIGAKLAVAFELSQKAKEMSDSSEAILMSAQQDLQELYVSLDKKTGNDSSILHNSD